MKVLVTGASGFVGRHLVQALQTAGHDVVTAGWSSTVPLDFRVPLGPDGDWSNAVAGCDAVVHAGGLAHVLDQRASKNETRFSQINTAGTLALAEAAASAGVRRLVFISSIAVLGEFGTTPAHEELSANPTTPYGRSKLAAEQGLVEIGVRTGMVVTSLRPPLIYGADAGGRFAQMMAWCERRRPLPLGGIENQRSYLAIENLADVIRSILEADQPISGIFHVADVEALSTPELLRLIGTGLGKPARLFAVPAWMLGLMRKVGLAQPIDKLSGTLLLDCSKLRNTLDWQPPVTVRDGIRAAAHHYQQGR